MAENRNFAALDWLMVEIEEALNLARQSLEAYVENPQDATRIRFCLTHIHQVRGSLQMVELHGAAMLADEMEELAQAIMNGSCVHERDAQEVLMRSILQLPIYLEQVKSRRSEDPANLLPLLNDLRAARGSNLLSESQFFKPDLTAAKQIRGAQNPLQQNNAQFKAMAMKLRQMYQYSAAGVIKGVNIDENLRYMEKVFLRLHSLTSGTARQPLWHMALALVEEVNEDQLQVSVAFKTLLRQLEKEIRVLGEYGSKALQSFTKDELIASLLYYVTQIEHPTPRIEQLKHDFKLQQPHADELAGDRFIGPDPDTIRTVMAALNEELSTVKEALQLELDQERDNAAANALPTLCRMADTLSVLGLNDLRSVVVDQVDALEQSIAHQQLTPSVLHAVADQLVDVEQRLAILAASASEPSLAGKSPAQVQVNQAQETVLREARNGLELTKDAIIEYIASQWDRQHLQKVPAVLDGVRGGLSMIPQPRPAAIVQACRDYIQQQMLEGQYAPDWKSLDTLADAIASVEYFLERLTNSREDSDDMLLTLAEESIQSLGYDVTEFVAEPIESHQEPEQAEPESKVEPAAEPQDDHPQEPTSESAPKAGSELESEAELEPETEIAPEAELEPVLPAEPESEAESMSEASVVEESELILEVAPDSEQANTEQQSLAEADDDDDLIDDEILEIFVEEAREVLDDIDQYFPQWAADFSNGHALSEFRRAFHTLKGSGRMVGASDIGELGWAIENMLNRVIDGSIQPHAVQVALISQVREQLPSFINAFEAKQPCPNPEQLEQLRVWGEEIAQGVMPEALLSNLPDMAIDSSTAAADIDDGEQYAIVDSDTDAPSSSIAGTADTDDSFNDDNPNDDDSNDLLWEIFGSEALTHLAVVDAFVHDMEQAAPIYTPPSEAMQRALHTLKGSAHMAEVHAVAELATPLERFAKELRSYQVNIDDDILQLIKDASAYTYEALEQIKNGTESVTIAKLEPFLARVAELRDRSVGYLIRQEEAQKAAKVVDPELLSIFMAEGMMLLLDADTILQQWQQQPSAPERMPDMLDELRTLANGAQQANLPPMAQLSESLASVYEAANGNLIHVTEAGFDTLQQAHEVLLDMVDAIAAGQNLNAASDELLDALQQLAVPMPLSDSLEREPEPVEPSLPTEADGSLTVESSTSVTPDASEFVDWDSASNLPVDDSPLDNDGDIDPEIIEIFLEEAQELMEDIEHAVHDWSEDWSLQRASDELKRALHTLKGGARLAGMVGVGNLSHNFETDVIHDADNNLVNEAFFARAHVYQERIQQGLEQVRDAMAGSGSLLEALLAEPEVGEVDAVEASAVNAGSPEAGADGSSDVSPERDVTEVGTKPVSKPETQPDSSPESNAEGTDNSAEILPFLPNDNVPVVTGGEGFTLPPQKAPAAASGNVLTSPLQARRSAPQEVVKVSAELLEELVNLAGETSISRGRMEEQVSELGFAIDEMDTTIARLQEQLRRLDIETEAQILFRQEQMAEMEDFDPLEMDRYSQLQQLSRSLIESASDLMDLKTTLSDKTRDTETLLLQQSRINTDLQEGLMRSRMVPFSRMVPRLRRIVRQVSAELEKKVNFELDNVEGEMDRTVMERMVAPLEHMLRNAVDHGIELPAERLKAGKAEAGRVILTLGREGGDVVLRLIDDGRGVDLERVRAKAIERGLMSAEAQLSDSDVMQFILHAGFSTAESVTQISGRGVGMDVVHQEIKQLGGSMAINSSFGAGTEFVVRLPFTVSVNRALMVRIGDERYAVPLNTIEGIVRVSPFELEHYYQNPESRFEYASEQYQVRYLGTLLNSDSHPKLEGQAMPLPVVLVRTAQNAVALQVDMLMGSREIVVKSLGPQFSGVTGVSGATVMGDGSVVVILDPYAMIRQEAALAHMPETLLPSASANSSGETAAKTIMVVDDSVTVRKVTSRFLEREGFEVVTAKDGADAMLMLQEHIPDLMLLDIEMPRMDGFEVAKNVRASSRLRDIPIIMITSRTGNKHRDRALQLGVNTYMGKPYQEDKLLENIRLQLGDWQADGEAGE